MAANFRRKFTFNNYPSKSNIHQWVTKFQDAGTIDDLNCKPESPKMWQKRDRNNFLQLRSNKELFGAKSEEISP